MRAGEVVLEQADRAGVLVAAPLVEPRPAAAKDLVGADRFIALGGGVAVEAEVVAELPGAEFSERVLAERAVPFTLDPNAYNFASGRIRAWVQDVALVQKRGEVMVGCRGAARCAPTIHSFATHHPGYQMTRGSSVGR